MATIREYLENRAANDATILSLFDEWSGDSASYAIGKVVMYGGMLYRCIQSHTSQSDWDPKGAVSLWAEVLTNPDGGDDDDDILDWVQPESTNPYMMGDKVRHNGKIWESIMDYNVWEPGVAGWTEVTS